jgi:hypothetical protein
MKPDLRPHVGLPEEAQSPSDHAQDDLPANHGAEGPSNRSPPCHLRPLRPVHFQRWLGVNDGTLSPEGC